nr:MAG TPA: amantadine-binding protein [Caudoviricetes sp.]
MDAIKLVVKRVEEEHDELKKKVERLERTVECFAKNTHITNEHKLLLRMQLLAMKQYLEVLNRRLMLFEQALESNDIPKEFDKKFNF